MMMVPVAVAAIVPTDSTTVVMPMESGQIVSNAATDTIPEVIRIHVMNMTACIRTNGSSLKMMVADTDTLMPGSTIRDTRDALTAVMPAGKVRLCAMIVIHSPGVANRGAVTMMPWGETLSRLDRMMGDAVSVAITKSGGPLMTRMTTGQSIGAIIAAIVDWGWVAQMGMILTQCRRAVMAAHERWRVLQLMSGVIGHVELSAVSRTASIPQSRTALVKAPLVKVVLGSSDMVLLRCAEMMCRSPAEPTPVMNCATTEATSVMIRSAAETTAMEHASAESAVMHSTAHMTATHVAPAHMAASTAPCPWNAGKFEPKHRKKAAASTAVILLIRVCIVVPAFFIGDPLSARSIGGC
jgi:hypothetical protein